MNGEEIERLVAKSEIAAVEINRAWGGVPDDFWSTYSSFANTDCAVIIPGVRSGMSFPSLYGARENVHFPRRLADLSETMQIRLLNHLIVATTRGTAKGYCSI